MGKSRNKSDISVVIPIYNCELFITRCLRSLFTQTKTNGVEFIIINDASSDNSMGIVRSIIDQYPQLDIRVVENEKNLGTFETRCIGIMGARGEYSIHIDSDDWWEPTTLEELWYKVESTNADILIFDAILEFDSGYKRRRNPNIYEDPLKCLPNLLLWSIMNSLWSKLVRTKLYEEADIQPIARLCVAEDRLINVKLFLKASSVAYLPRALYHYNKQNNASLTANYNLNSVKDEQLVLEEIIDSLHKEGAMTDEIVSVVNTLKIDLYFKLLVYSTRQEQKDIYKYYNEAMSEIWKYKRDKFKNRLAMWLASKGLLRLANVILFKRRRRAAARK